MDYRQLTGQFDRVVSVGMMEHVGIGHFDEYFLKIRELLTPDGYAFIHCIGRMSQPGTTGPFIRKYIFPGAYVPALSETFAATERCGLWCDDMEVLRLHYRYTVKHWRERFAKNRARAAAIYDERFCRMWEFYLAAVELEFLHGSHMVFQLLLSTKRDAVPITTRFYGRRRAGGLGAASQLNEPDPTFATVFFLFRHFPDDAMGGSGCPFSTTSRSRRSFKYTSNTVAPVQY